MRSESLLGYLAGNLTQQRENLATEALGFILRSRVACEALVQALEQVGVSLPKDMFFETQAIGENLDRPDLCGKDGDSERLLIEAKFWADLTKNQPNGYLDRLTHSKKPAAVLFVAPEKRLESLWEKILSVCSKKYQVQRRKTISGWHKASLDGNLFLLLASWRDVLQRIRTALESDGDYNATSDVRQLEGLTDQMDDEQFLPFKKTDLSPDIPRVVNQLTGVVDNVVERITGSGGFAERCNSHTIAEKRRYGHRFLIGNVHARLLVDYKRWARCSDDPDETPHGFPLWLVLSGTDRNGKDLEKCRSSLNGLKASVLMHSLSDRQRIRIPIVVPTDTERDQVVDKVCEAIREIKEKLEAVRDT